MGIESEIAIVEEAELVAALAFGWVSSHCGDGCDCSAAHLWMARMMLVNCYLVMDV